jgi:hypothetical protein
MIEAIPFYILRGAPVDIQLYAGRITSLLFLLLAIYCAYELTCELTPLDHPLRWMVPLFVSLLPGFVEFMSSVNDYVGAVGIFSLWILIVIRLIKKFTYPNALFLLLITLAGYFTQKVLYPLILYLPVVILLSLTPKKLKYLGWLATACLAIIGILVTFSWGDAAYWLKRNYQDFPTRVQISSNNDPTYALQEAVYPDTAWNPDYLGWNPGFFQLIPSDVSDSLMGKTVTIGAWMWSDHAIQAYGPGLNCLLGLTDHWYGFKPVDLDNKPQFIATVLHIPNNQGRLQVWLRATSPGGQTGRIFISGVVLAQGEMPLDIPPSFTDQAGIKGIWGRREYTNLIRNPQFQQTWPAIRPQIFQLINYKINDLTPTHISSFISIFFDYPGTNWYWHATGDFLFRTFWAKFSWGQLPLMDTKLIPHPYRILLATTLLGIIGGFIFGYPLAIERKSEFAFLLVMIATTVVVTLFYGVYTMGGALRFRAYIPTARYIYPAILPISFILVLGWQGILAWISKLLRISPYYSDFLFLGFLVALEAYSIFSIVSYFRV